MFRSLLGAAALFIASFQAAHSATYQINFTVGAYTGFLTFNSYADGPVNATGLQMTSNNIGELGSDYNQTSNGLYFQNGELFAPTFPSATFATATGSLARTVHFRRDRFELICSDALFQNRCNGANVRSFTQNFDDEPFAFDNKISAVPLPAGAVLFLSGFAGLAGLRLRQRKLR